MRVSDESIREELRAVGTTMRNTSSLEEIPGVFAYTSSLTAKMRGVWESSSVTMEQCQITRPDGTDMRTCVFRSVAAENDAPVTGILWIHGGGYVLGAPEQERAYFEAILGRCPAVIVSPDYTLSLEKPYPAAFDDCCMALRWMAENAEALGIRSDQLFVAGESAGGGLTLAVCLHARDKGDVSVAFMMPICPMIDDRMTTASSMDNDAPVWDSKNNQVGWSLYLGELMGHDVPAYAAPARAADLAGMPPAASYVGTIEPFHDEAVELFARLSEFGIEATLKEFEGCFHGFESVCPQSEAAAEAYGFIVQSIAEAQKKYFAVQPLQ